MNQNTKYKKSKYSRRKVTTGSVIKIAVKTVLKIMLTAILIGVITGSIVATGVVYYLFKVVDKDPGVDLKEIRLKLTSEMYVNDEETGLPVLYEKLHGEENRTWVDYEQMPKAIKDAAVAIEDERFWEHKGVDWKRTLGAVSNIFFSTSDQAYGGSTITQQLIKNITQDSGIDYSRKIREIFRALELEKMYPKEQILEAYLNSISLANGRYGVQAAANFYFNKDVNQLNPAECAAIIGITQYPVKYDPILNPEYNKEKQEIVLEKMRELGYLTEAQYREAIAYKLDFKGTETVQNTSNIMNWYQELVIDDVLSDLRTELGYTKAYAEDMLFNKGLKIYSSMNLEIQEMVERYARDPETYNNIDPDDPDPPESAMMIIDYKGRIHGVSGSNRPKTLNRVFSFATHEKRAIGSTMKPLGVYAPAIDLDVITYSTVIANEPVLVIGGNRWPPNFPGNPWGGAVTVQEAVARSLNTVPVAIIEKDLGYENSFEYCYNKFHMTSLVKERLIFSDEDNEDNAYDLYSDLSPSALALGGPTDGLTQREVVGAFQMFGNGGKYNKPYTYTKVIDSKGNVLLSNDYEPQQAIGEDSAWVMNQLLQRVVESGTASAYIPFDNHMTMFGKTGTAGTGDITDNVTFAGGSPYFAASTWYGYKYNDDMDTSISKNAQALWRRVMQEIHQGYEDIGFDYGDTLVVSNYCTASGNLFNPGTCGSSRVGYYKPSNVPGMCNGSHAGGKASSKKEETSTPAPSEAASSEPPPSSQEQQPSSEPPPPSSEPPPPSPEPPPPSPATPPATQAPSA